MNRVLYTLPISNYCAKVEIGLRLKSLPFEVVAPPGGYGSAEFKAIAPLGTIPALVDNGLTLSESEAILEYLEEAYPEPGLLPRDVPERAKVRQAARLHDVRFEPVLRAMFGSMDPARRDGRWINDQIELLQSRLSDIENILQRKPYLSGDRPGLADCGYAPTWLLASWMLKALGVPVLQSDLFDPWFAKVRQHGAFAPVLATHQDAIVDWLQKRGAL